MDSSGGSEEREAVGVDFCGEAFLFSDLVLRSGRPELLDVVEECCDCDWSGRALEDRRGSGPAILGGGDLASRGEGKLRQRQDTPWSRCGSRQEQNAAKTRWNLVGEYLLA